MAKRKSKVQKKSKKNGDKGYPANAKRQDKKMAPLVPTCQITSPTTTAGGYLVPSSGICVQGIATNAATVHVTLILNSEPEPAPPASATSGTYEEATPSGTDFAVEVPYKGKATNPSETATYKVVAYPADNQTPPNFGTPRRRTFRRIPESFSTSVDATCCPWFALTPPGASGPYGSDEVPDAHRPVEMEVPLNAGTATFNANGEWRHGAHSGTKSDADGRMDLQTLREIGPGGEDYSTVPGVSSIAEFESPQNVNLLIGVWKTSPTGYDEFAIGSAPPPFSVPDDTKLDRRMFLAMHDGKRWFNNSGFVNVNVNWSAEICNTTAAKKQKAKKKAKKTSKKKK